MTNQRREGAEEAAESRRRRRRGPTSADEGRAAARSQPPRGGRSRGGEVLHAPSLLAYGLGAGGILLVVVALFFIGRGDITLGPVFLVIAYLVVFPLALTLSDRAREDRSGGEGA